MLDCLINAHNLRVGLCAYQTGKAVAGIAANAAALVRVLLVEHDANRYVEGLETRTCKVVGQLLNARLMADGRPGIGGVRRRFGRIFSAVPVHLIQILGLRVVRFQIVITERPRGRDATMVANFAEIFFAQTEQSSTVKLGVATHVIISVRMQLLTVLIEPGFLGVVVGVHVDDLWVPIRFLAGNVVAALKNQDPLSGWRQVVGERSAAGTGSDDDHVVAIVGHDANPPLAPQNMQRLLLSWWSLQHFTAWRPFRHRYNSDRSEER